MIGQAKLAQIVQQRHSTLKFKHQEVFDEIAMYYQMYRAFMDEDPDYPWEYQYVDPQVFYILRNIMARLNPDNMSVRLEARNSKSYALRESNQAVINWEMGEMSKTLTFYRFLFRGLLAGRAYLSSGWRYEPAVVVQGPQGRQVIMKDIVNRADLSNIRFTDLLIPNRSNPELDEQPYIMERVTLRYGDMLDDNKDEKRKKWKPSFLKKVREKKMFASKMDFGFDLPKDDSADADNTNYEEMFYRSQYVELIKMVTKEGDELFVPVDEVQEVVNIQERTSYWHGHYCYITWTPFPEDEDFYSMGIVQPVADLIQASSSALNQYLTNARKAANPMWIAGKDASQTPDYMFVNRPDGVIRVAGDPNQIVPVRPPDSSGTMLPLRQELQTTIERSTSMSSLYMGGVSGPSSPAINKTATGARTIDANLDLNMQLLVGLFGAQALSKVGEHFLELNAQYLTDEQEVKISGGKDTQFMKVKPEEITASFDVIAAPDTILKQDPAVKEAGLLNIKAAMDAEQQVKLDKRPVWKVILDGRREFDNIGNIIIDPQEQAQEAIDSITKGIIPEVTYNIDHPTVLTIVQKYMQDEQLDDMMLSAFVQYTEELRKWIQAAKPQLTAPPQPPLLPTDPNALMDSMALPENPTQSLPNSIPLDQLAEGSGEPELGVCNVDPVGVGLEASDRAYGYVLSCFLEVCQY